MLLQIGRHWINHEAIEAVLDGARHGSPECDVVLSSGQKVRFDMSASDFVDAVAVKWRKMIELRPQAPEIGTTSRERRSPGPGHEQLVQGGH